MYYTQKNLTERRRPAATSLVSFLPAVHKDKFYTQFKSNDVRMANKSNSH